ncbi:DUF6056 family protein [Nonomuraea sp. NPDC050556]|uniref:DUF6056 family protein n=1 Tax=Nonomuraea sp. NPDC050556 TaxID=3364369 RepID=UPI003792EAC5
MSHSRLTWVVLAPLAGLCAVVAVLGLYVRPTSDDYRLAVLSMDGGILDACAEFYLRVTGRVGNALLAVLLYARPEIMLKIIPSLTFLGLALAVGMLVGALLSRAGRPRNLPLTALVGMGVAALVLLGQPRAYQTLFWAPGVISHTLPSIVLIVLVALALRCGPRFRLPFLGVAFVLALLLGTTSEPATLVWLVVYGFICLTHLMFARRWTFLLVFGAVLAAGLVAGLAIVLTSPGNGLRQAGAPAWHGAASSPLDPQVIGDAASMTVAAFSELAGRGYLLAALALGGVVALHVRDVRLARWRLVWMVAGPVLAVACAGFAVQYAVRYGYGDIGWIVYRVWVNFSVVMVIALVWLGFLAASLLVRRGRGGLAVGLAVYPCLMLACVGYAAVLGQLGREMTERAAVWDAQSAAIARQRAFGASVVPYRPLPIAALAEPFMNGHQHDWLLGFVARFYGVAAVVRESRTDCLIGQCPAKVDVTAGQVGPWEYRLRQYSSHDSSSEGT